jgi:hypothetical protein
VRDLSPSGCDTWLSVDVLANVRADTKDAAAAVRALAGAPMTPAERDGLRVTLERYFAALAWGDVQPEPAELLTLALMVEWCGLSDEAKQLTDVAEKHQSDSSG